MRLRAISSLGMALAMILVYAGFASAHTGGSGGNMMSYHGNYMQNNNHMNNHVSLYSNNNWNMYREDNMNYMNSYSGWNLMHSNYNHMNSYNNYMKRYNYRYNMR